MFKWLASETVNKATDTLSKVAQITALVIAGVWTYKTFFESVAPGLELRGGANADLNWSKSSDPEDCQGSLNITISNDGVKSFSVSKVQVRGWLYTSDRKLVSPTDMSIPKPTAEMPVFLDYTTIDGPNTFFDHTYPDKDHGTLLAGHYPPGAKYNTPWIFTFKKTPVQGVLFRADVTTDTTTQFVPLADVSDDTCTLPDVVTAAKPTDTSQSKK